MLNLSQGDCKCGALAFVAGADLSAASGKLAKLNAVGKAVLPEAPADITPYVLACGADEGYLCGVVPLTSSTNARVVLKGSCLPGDVLVSVGDGRVEKRTELTAGLAVGTAEEAGQEGQRVLLRPLGAAGGGGAGQAVTPGTQSSQGALRVSGSALGFSPAAGQCLFLVNTYGAAVAWFESVPESNTGVCAVGVVTGVPAEPGGDYEITVIVTTADGNLSRVPLAVIAGDPAFGCPVNPAASENGYFLTAGDASSFTAYKVAYLAGRDATHAYLCVGPYTSV